jgi:hypothetical protein
LWQDYFSEALPTTPVAPGEEKKFCDYWATALRAEPEIGALTSGDATQHRISQNPQIPEACLQGSVEGQADFLLRILHRFRYDGDPRRFELLEKEMARRGAALRKISGGDNEYAIDSSQ